MIRVFTKKTYKFTNGSESRTTGPLQFTDLPDWVKKDPLFQWGVADGTIEFIKNGKQQAVIENNPNKKDLKSDKSPADTPPAHQPPNPDDPDNKSGESDGEQGEQEEADKSNT